MRPVCLHMFFFSTLHITLPHNLFKDTLIELIDRIFQRKGSHYIACNKRSACSPPMQKEIIIYGLVRKSVELSAFSKTIFILILTLK